MTDDAQNAWPTLCALATSVFDEDWPDDFDHPSYAVDEFLRRYADHAQDLVAEIDQVLAVCAETDLREFFESIDLLVEPGVDLNTYRGWLAGVSRRASLCAADSSRTEEVGDVKVAEPGTAASRWPSLAALSAEYFRAGWEADAYCSSRLVIENVMAKRPDLAYALPTEIDEVLAEFHEKDMRAVFEALNLNYDPSRALNTYRGWLTEVARRVQRPLDDEV